ncbi:FAD/NAD(P)-binding oxidoreductase [Halomonas piscis]|uniref:FAD/NAD(P)-binding oxidoreductase n=1 Tax=Halomonas piscis TaxID=3031727 RepID=A0ABY9Z044_9GAMM|nr:FAD/NAD(P)-binding oxidoreductase [Halomonas piscis]WNK20392.1 FAD/NAD(P)-binding oxidoreductase [Halomonas piscis]
MPTESETHRHQVVIIGGGTAGITVAASLKRRRPGLDIAIVEPSERHYYQPAFTLVGGGAYALDKTRRATRDVLPRGVTLIKAAVTAFDPDNNRVELDSGESLGYASLVVAPGIKLDWGRVEGLEATLGKNGVCSNYSPETVEYTARCLNEFTGGNAIFTQPAPPLKCAGAPQKIAYLAADHVRRNGLADKTTLKFYSGGGALFSVPDFVPPLERVAQRHGVEVILSHDLVAVDGENKLATFEAKSAEGEVVRIEQPFDLLHVTPYQCAPDVVAQSPLADAGGWVEVDKATTQHLRYPNVFSLGDASSLPTSKTAAAVRKQAPVTVQNLLAQLDDKAPTAEYDGYTSCPLVTDYGRVMIAEFIYGGVVAPTLPLDPFKESRFYWWVKKSFLPAFYWRRMLKGCERDIAHKPRKTS